MKKLAGLLVVLLVIVATANSEQYTYYKGKCNQIIGGSQRTVEYELQYDDTNEDIWFVRNVNKSFTAFLIKKDNVEKIRSAIKKYFEWEKVAVENKKTIQKDIPDASFDSQEIMSVYGQSFNNKVNIYFTFFSQNSKIHQFIIRGTKRTGVMEDYYFTKTQSEEFERAFSEENLNTFKTKLTAQKQRDNDLFN